MAVYAVNVRRGETERAFASSPKTVLVADSLEEENLPPEIRAATDELAAGDLSIVRAGGLSGTFEATLIWLRGDRLLHGNAQTIRADLLVPGARTFAPVHLPYLTELDLVGLQPRAITAKPRVDIIDGGFRIGGSAELSPQAREALEANPEPWSRLYLALLAEKGCAGSGMERLQSFWKEQSWHPSLQSLVLRNLAVMMIRHGNIGGAEELLKTGMGLYAEYAELRYIMALLRISQGCGDEAMSWLRDLTRQASPSYVGSGGETSYRANYLIATLADQVGRQQTAVAGYLAGVKSQPAYEPSVFGLLKQRLPNELVSQLRVVLFALVQREPKYFDPVFYFLLLHRQTEAARRLLASVELPDSRREAMTRRIDEVAHGRRNPVVAGKPGVILTGPFFVASSVARINRALAGALAEAPDLDVALEPHGYATAAPRLISGHSQLTAGLNHHVASLELTIRHHWPPRFERPARGKLAVIVPWEFRGVPRRWIDQIERHVDELWVPSTFVREVFIRGGLDPARVRVIPNGVDTDVFAPQGARWLPEGCRGFVFLFVGGAIQRKGVDVLAAAYRRAFSRSDEVTLVVKDLGSTTFYRHNSLVADLQRLAEDATQPRLVVLTQEMDDPALAALYRAADALVLPYRGEGFGMPIAEAMACGKPVITTELGPSRDFCSDDTTYLIPATISPVPGDPPPFGELSEPFAWFEPDVDALAERLRYVFEHRDEARRRGRLAAEKIRVSHSWPAITAMYLTRIRSLLGRYSPSPAAGEGAALLTPRGI